MAISSEDIVIRLSGGASNSSPAASLGGAKSSTAVIGSTLFDTVSGAESAAGSIEYRCVYIHNAHATLTLIDAKAWLVANTESSDTTIDIGVGTAAINGTEQTIADETTAPSGVSFSAAASEGAAIALGDIPAGEHRSIWQRRTVSPGASASNDTATIRVKGDTEA